MGGWGLYQDIYVLVHPPCCRKHTSLTAASPAHFQRLSHTVVTATFTYVFVSKPNVFVKNLNVFVKKEKYCSHTAVTTTFIYVFVSKTNVFVENQNVFFTVHSDCPWTLSTRDLTYYSTKGANHLKVVSMRNLSNWLILESKILPSITRKPLSIGYPASKILECWGKHQNSTGNHSETEDIKSIVLTPKMKKVINEINSKHFSNKTLAF